MAEPIGSQRDAASMLFNLPGYRVIAVNEEPRVGRWVDIEVDHPPVCPHCASEPSRVHSRRCQRVRDIPGGDGLIVIWRKRRWFCDNTDCAAKTFSEHTGQVPAYARSTIRFGDYVVDAVARCGRAVSEVAASCSVSWWLVQACLHTAVHALPQVDDLVVVRIGVDEHRFRRVRYFEHADGRWLRFEPWMSTIVDLDTGRVLGVIDGRDNKGVAAWLAARSAQWRDRIEVVAIDPSAAFAKAIRTALPRAALSVDGFHLVMKANDAVTAVRQRLTRDLHGRRGRSADPVWAHRLLLLRGANTLSERGWARLKTIFDADDPTDELSAAWAVKEQLRRLLNCSSLDEAHEEKMRLGHYVQVANMAETDTLWSLICKWWPAIEVLIVTGVSNAKTEAANTAIKNIKRTARGFRNTDQYRTRILLSSATRRAA